MLLNGKLDYLNTLYKLKFGATNTLAYSDHALALEKERLIRLTMLKTFSFMTDAGKVDYPNTLCKLELRAANTVAYSDHVLAIEKERLIRLTMFITLTFVTDATQW
jgi:hypothetical protein